MLRDNFIMLRNIHCLITQPAALILLELKQVV